MKLEYLVYINGQLHKEISKRLLSFVIIDNVSLSVDTLEVSINNSDDSINIPSTSATIELVLGYNNDLTKMGVFNIDFISLATETVIKIKATSIKLENARIKQTHVFKDEPLANILKTVANNLKLNLVLDNSLKTEKISYFLQQDKTPLSVLQEMADLYYAIVKITNTQLSFMKKESAKILDIDENAILKIYIEDLNNNVYKGIAYKYWDTDQAKLLSINLGKQPYLMILNNVDKKLIKTYLSSKYKALKETQQITIILQGDMTVQSGFLFNIKGEKYINFLGKYQIKKVLHQFNSAYTTKIIAIKI